MALKVKSASVSAAKWDNNAAQAADAFASEAHAASSLWEAQTKAAKDNYHKAITASGIADRFLGGVTRAGAAKFARKIVDRHLMLRPPDCACRLICVDQRCK